MGFFYLAGEGKVPVAFKLCGLFQAACDLGLGAQWWAFGEGEGVAENEREWEKGKGMMNGMNGKTQVTQRGGYSIVRVSVIDFLYT